MIVFFRYIATCHEGNRSLVSFIHMAIEDWNEPVMMLMFGQHRLASAGEGFFQCAPLGQRFIKMRHESGAEVVL